MKLTSRQITLVANALALAAETYEGHKQTILGIEDQSSVRNLLEQFRWQEGTCRELSETFLHANDVIVEGDE